MFLRSGQYTMGQGGLARRRWWVWVTLLLLVITAVGLFARTLWHPLYTQLMGRKTLEQAVAEYGPSAEQRLRERFAQAGVDYPPPAMTWIGLKAERQLEVWAKAPTGEWRRIHRYPVLAASGVAGPKLREGDKQVPEGLYRLVGFNPNSAFHLSLKVDYPNAFDLKHAQAEGRDQPGTNIFIHGRASSVGCLAIGDEAIEELFVAAYRVGLAQIDLIIAPHDARQTSLLPVSQQLPAWSEDLYQQIESAMRPFAL